MKFPDYNQFVLPYGRGTNSQFAGNAVNAYGNMLGQMATASANEAQADASRYGAYAGGLGSTYGGYASGLGNIYGGYGSLLSNTANSASNAYTGLAGGLGSLGGSRSNASAAKDNAYTGLATGMGGAFANNYGAYSGLLGNLANAQSNEATGLANAYAGMSTGMANALANTYGGYSSGLGNVAGAMASEEGARYSSNAMAEAARQAGLANIASSALGAYGSAAGSALGAYGQAEAARQAGLGNIGASYMNSLGGLGSANQNAISSLGQSRNNALGNLGAAYANAATGLGGAAVAGDLDLSFNDAGYSSGGGGGSFSASGPGGGIASGSWGDPGGYGSGGMSLNVSRDSDNSRLDSVLSGAFSGLGDVGVRLDNQQGYDELARGFSASRGALADGYTSAAGSMAPISLGDIMQDSLAGFGSMASDGYANMNAGMDQFYGNQASRNDYSSILSRLTDGYADASQVTASPGDVFRRSDYSGYSDSARDGFNQSSGDLLSLADRGFSGVAGNNYQDADLLGTLAAGYGSSLGQIDNATNLGTMAMMNAAGSLGSGFEQTADRIASGYGQPRSGGVAGRLLESLLSNEDEEAEASPYRQSLLREYEALMGGNTNRFNHLSPLFDSEAAKQKAWLEGQLRSRGGLR